MNKAGSAAKVKLNSFDDLFGAEQPQAGIEQVQKIALSELYEFKGHPFKVLDDEKMQETVESVREHGVLMPGIARPRAEGGYEIIAGHRRRHACELVGLETMPMFIRNYTDDEATIIMVDSNIQRENILPSEKAFAYKMKLDAMKHQGKRTDLTSVQTAQKSKTSRALLSEQTGESQDQIRRYIRLTYLIPELLQMVDEGKMKMLPAVEISFLDKECQQDLLEAIESECCTPSHAQAIRMHKMFNDGELNGDTILDVMCELKPNQQERLIIPHKTLEKYIPKSVAPEKRQDYVCKALEHYNKFLKSRAERDSR